MKNWIRHSAMSMGLLAMSATAQVKPFGPVPTEDQLRWQEMEMYAFIHYSLNTYTDEEWGFGNEKLELFNPSDLDCRQWARVCKQAGMKGIIFTAKHHCGFCMWPSQYTEYSVKNTPWKGGKGDVVRELADACREEGLKFAVYLSPWDRNHAEYGRPAYVTYFRNQLRELLTQYGDIFEVWFDGANGGDGWYGGANETRRIDGKTYYQWAETFRMIRELQPHAVIWNDGGDRGDLRWVGTEAGNVGVTNWSLLNKEGDVHYEQLHYGLENGDSWVPGETNTSIRPGWFYHTTEDTHVKSLSKLMDTYYKSVGRNSTLLLNFPVMPNGRIHPTDSLRGIAFKKMIDEVFKENLIDHGTLTIDNPVMQKEVDANNGQWSMANDQWPMVNVQWEKPTAFNRFLVEEDIRYGQRVKRFALEAEVNGQWIALRDELAETPPTRQGADGGGPVSTGLTTIGHRRIVCFPTVTATRLRLTILDAKAEPLIKRVGVYNAPELTADIPDAGEKLSSGLHIFFSNPRQMMIDYEREQTITAFRYLPPQNTRNGLVTHYTLWASSDWQDWTKVASGEFSNIVNNPIWQTVKFTSPVRAKILRLDADRLAEGNRMGYEDVEVVRAVPPTVAAPFTPRRGFPQAAVIDSTKFYTVKAGDVTMTVDAGGGGKILSLKHKGTEVISQSRWPESFGSTFWTSPQKEWNWPPVPEFDKRPFTVEQESPTLVMSSEVSERLKCRVRKEFAHDATDNAIVITYTIINESDETRSVAPWEITRVPNEGLIFFDAPVDAITPQGLMDFKAADGAAWYQTDEAPQNRKVNADGHGWLAYAAKGLLLLKVFDDLKASQPAPDEAEIQVYVNRGKTFIELESQGAYTALKPGESLSWTVRWYLEPLVGEAVPSKQLVNQACKKRKK